jgi:hypothetical protein
MLFLKKIQQKARQECSKIENTIIFNSATKNKANELMILLCPSNISRNLWLNFQPAKSKQFPGFIIKGSLMSHFRGLGLWVTNTVNVFKLTAEPFSDG